MEMPKLMQDLLRDSNAVGKKKNIMRQMMSERSQFEPTWKQLSDYINPTRGRFDSEDKTTDGKRRDYFLLDPYPMEACGKCAAGIHSGLTSPSRPWFSLSLQDDELANYHKVKMWLEECQQMLMGIYAKSNIYNMLLQLEAELTQFGTAAALMLEDYHTGIWARTYTCGEYAGNVDARGRVTQFARRFKLTAWQMVEEFGEDVCSDAVKAAYKSQNYKDYFPVTMLIEKNLGYDENAPNALGNFPWRSYYFEACQTDCFLKIAGYHEVPFLMPRWTTVANGIYGVGPGHNALGNCMQLQKLEQVNMRLLETRANPPMIVPASVGKVNRLPGKETLVPDNLANLIRPLYETTGSREEVMDAIQHKQQQIGAAFYNDLFVMLAGNDNPQMTAREVAERHEEKLLMLSPVLEQMHNEVLAPLTKRTFEICMRNGVFPPIPPELEG
ncbi:MAG: portal protein, partial [Candidatus Cloacimonetes bacterium]|nr:portal protein [Candidatus Cloacimonadota bacterium]